MRSSFKDWATETTNHANEVSEMALAHKISNAVEAAYRRGNLYEKRCQLMNDWADYQSSIECSKLVASSEANIVGYACIIDRSNGKSEIKEKIVSQIELNIPTYNKDNLPKELSSIKAIKPGSRNL